MLILRTLGELGHTIRGRVIITGQECITTGVTTADIAQVIMETALIMVGIDGAGAGAAGVGGARRVRQS